MSASSRVAGFTLIEVLVALVVLSLGMLGIASLYTQALGAGRSTQFRGQAVNLLADMADRIRANRNGQGDYAGGAADGNCDATDCTPAEMAAHDLFEWDQQVTGLLPAGEWEVDFDNGTNPPTYTMRVRWAEVGEAALLEARLDIQVPLL